MDKLLSSSIFGSSKDAEQESTIVETLKKHLSRDLDYKLADLIWAQAKETFDLWLDLRRWNNADVGEKCVDMSVQCSNTGILQLASKQEDR